MHISLAHFEANEQKEDNSIQSSGQGEGKSKGCSEADLEGKILNQLIHQIDPDNIPQTNFKVKQKIPTDSIMKNTVLITVFLILSVYIAFFNSWTQFVSTISQQWLKNLLVNTTNSAGVLASGVLCSVLLSFVIHFLVKTQKNKNIFKKVNLQGSEIEIFEENDESYFDKYLNEVLYLFENSGADVIVFEDIDRYNKNQIFEKLREINILVNSRRKKEMRFFYLLRDDIFITKNRTKFFDFIIPVVPVIDSSNSYDQFIEHFKQGGIFHLFNENFLQGLSLYVDDMRILKNIYNEFIIYHSRLNSTELNINKLLAIVVYKNIFPRDFSDLQLGKGYVHTLFASKNEFIEQRLQDIDLQIKKINDDINSSNDEMLNSIDELDAAYLLVNVHVTNIAGNNVSAYKTRTQLIRAIKENKDAVYHQTYYQNLKMDVTHELKKLTENPEYIKRKEVIERKTNNQLEKLKAELQKLQAHKPIVENSHLQELITKENINTIFSVVYTNEIGEVNNFNEIKASPYFPLIKYLIRHGYINETYSDYMTYFYANSLSLTDKVFLRSVTDQIPREYAYSIKNPQLVLSRLRLVDFDHEEILNFDLLSYLLRTWQENITYLIRFLKQLANTRNLKFIVEFLEKQRERDIFIKNLNNLWPGVFHCILTESNFDYEIKKQYAVYTLYFSDDTDIKAVNMDECLSTFISQSPDFLNITTPNINKIINGFSLINAKFSWIEHKVSNTELFAAVYKNSQYQLTFDLISLMLEKIYKLAKSNDFRTKNYTLISSNPDEPLVAYVNENIIDYMGIILNNCAGVIYDEEPAALNLINNTDLEVNLKQEYINLLQTIIERIDSVEDKELWIILLQNRHVKYSSDNVLKNFFLKAQGMDPSLIEFINGNSDNLSFDYELIDKVYGDKSGSQFLSAIVTCNQLDNKKYEDILVSLDRIYEEFSYEEILEEKIIILIKIGVIEMTIENLQFMRKHYKNNLMMFIRENIAQYVDEVINDDSLISSEIIDVLDENILDDHKIRLLQHTGDKVSIKHKKYSDAVKLHILGHNLDENDLSFLLASFPLESEAIKEAIIPISIRYINKIIGEEYSIPFELAIRLLNESCIETESQKQLFLLSLPNMNEEQAKECLLKLKMRDIISLFDRKRSVKFEINSINERILNEFQEKRWITSFDIDKNDPGYFRIFIRKADDEKIPVEIL